MDGVILRGARREDIGDICQIWEVCFGDAPETVEKLLEPETLENTTVAELDGRVRALMAGFDGLEFGGVRASYIFALCTVPDYRGRGLGGRVLRGTARRCFERGAELVCLHPASEGLARWYAHLGLETFSRASFGDAPGAGAAPGLRRVGAEEYAALRAGAGPRVPGALLRAQELFYSGADGGFFAFDGGAMCVQRGEGGAELRELLCPEGRRAAVREAFGGSALLPRVLSADSGQGSTHLMGLWRDASRRDLDKPPYLPFLLD